MYYCIVHFGGNDGGGVRLVQPFSRPAEIHHPWEALALLQSLAEVRSLMGLGALVHVPEVAPFFWCATIIFFK